ncbi:hypothetical protein STH1138 [Symbiobacterium thermophilum IAM 14863]|uniref:Uncharacterized protein n=1 Tax=Symbiobacterium thermophilum (strain DSM 24528 / JCM 14929 / IAM 14863 / T) TaxID=292459 RepID=Q67QC0_SYMTH|nr:hypothetical protein STH1138 [Symbiobacterium thermophilum IAM 14863]
MAEGRAKPMLTICNAGGFARAFVRSFKGSC